MINSLIPFGFLPVIAYLLTGLFANRRKALWSALAVGAAESGFALGTGRPDALGLAQFALLVVLVGASLRAGDDYYFRVHGALASIASAVVLMAAWYGFDRALLLDLSARQVGLDRLAALDPRLTPDLVAEMLRVLSFQLPWWLLLHALFTLYAAANWGKWAWALVRVPGFLLALLLASAMAQGAVTEELRKEGVSLDKPAPAGRKGAAAPAPAGAPAGAQDSAGRAPRR